jgi:DNA-binding beta-propeller fold protein YncE
MNLSSRLGARKTRWSGVCIVALFASMTLTTPIPAAASGSLPTQVGTLGGPDHANLYPGGLDIAPDGSIVVADTGNNVVRKYDSTGNVIWTVGPTGVGFGQFTGPRDIGVDSSGNIYVADDGSDVVGGGRIAKFDANGNFLTSWKGPADDLVGNPIGLSVANDLVYVADPNHKRVHVFNTSGTQLSDVVSNGICTIGRVRDATADGAGNVYVANYDLNNILVFSAAGTCLSKWGSKGSRPGQFAFPYGVAIATDPVLGTQAAYIADANNERIQELDLAGAVIAVIGSAGSAKGQFVTLRRVAVATDGSGDVWGADLWGYRLERFARQAGGYAYTQTVEGFPPPPIGIGHAFNQVRGIGFDSLGNVVAADTVNQRIVTIDSAGNVLQTCGHRGDGNGSFNWPRGVAVDPATGQYWIANTRQNNIQIIDTTCASVARLGKLGTGLGNLDWPHSIAIRGSDGTAWLADSLNNRVVSWNVATRSPIEAFGTKGAANGQFRSPRGIAIDPFNGHILVADVSNNRIVELSDSGGAGIQFLKNYKTGLGLSGPQGVAADAAGRIYIADSGNSRVVILNSDGSLIGSLTGFNRPENIAVDAGGRIYVADTYNDTIVVYSY